jgi:hypothetical protein
MIALFAHSLFSARSGVAEELGWCWNATQRTPQEHLGSVISTPEARSNMEVRCIPSCKSVFRKIIRTNK